jgi:regulatory protein
MSNSDNIKEALDKLRQICSRQEKCPADILTLLKKWDIDPQEYPGILEKLKQEKFLSESRYASAFVRDKIKFDHWGFIKIRFVLRQKGLDSAYIEDATREIDREEYRSMIGRELKKKRKFIKGTPREVWAKLARYGSSRGYELEMMQEFLGSGSDD